MVERWWTEAERNNVLPIDNRPFSDMVFGRPPVGRRRETGTPTGPAGHRFPRAWP